jgi:DNA-binding beta-propeller fold protein YncE
MKRSLLATAVVLLAAAVPMAATVPAVAAAPASPQARTVRTVTVGSNPIDIAISARNSRAYVLNDGSVSVLSTVTNRELAEVGTGHHDQTAIGLARNGTRAYIGTFDQAFIKVFNTATLKVTSTVRVGLGAAAITAANTKAGQFAYVALLSIKRVAIVRTSNNKLVKRVKLPAAPQSANATPNGQQVWIGSATSPQVWVLSTASQRVTRKISVPNSGPVTSTAFSPNGKQAWVYGFAGVSVISVATGKLLAAVPILRIFPRDPAPNSGSIALNNKGTFALIEDSTFPDTPQRGTIAVLNTRTLKLQSSIRVGTEPIGLAVDRRHNTTYVPNFQDDTVSFFRTPK